MSRFNTKKYVRLVCSLLTVFLLIGQADAQRFKGSAVGGINLAQIDGDELYGYNKLGFTGGFKLDYPLAEKFDISLEMLYSARGSTAGFGFGTENSEFTSLKYLDLPLMLSIKDWYVEDDNYFKVSAHAGLSLAYLFDATTSNDEYLTKLGEFSNIDFSYFFGINYRFSNKFGITIRHTRAFTQLIPDDDDAVPPVDNFDVSYFVTIRSEFYF